MPDTRPNKGQRGPGALSALGAALLTTLLVTLISYLARDYAATAVGLVFCGACGWLVLRHDAATISHYGLSLGGVLEPTPIDWLRLGKSVLHAILCASAVAIVVFPCFAFGFRWFWQIHVPFRFHLSYQLGDELLGQLLVVSLPEEAFFRGYLMTALDDAWGKPWALGGSKIGWGLLVSSAVFAVGHVLTQPDPARLAVFFPALIFGWLRARTGGVGASVVFHAMCNLFASVLARGYSL